MTLVGGLVPSLQTYAKLQLPAVATVLVGKALIEGLQGNTTAALDVVLVPGARPPLIAYFVMTLLTNLCTTRKYPNHRAMLVVRHTANSSVLPA